MSAKATINHLLGELTGHHLVKGKPGEAAARADEGRQLRKSVRDLRQSVDQLRSEVRGTLAATRGGRGKPGGKAERNHALPADYDEHIREIINAVRPYTMTGPVKLHGLIAATEYIDRHHIPGDIVECGVWRGGSMHAVARTLTRAGDQSRDLYLFDTFEGMPPPTERDVRHSGERAADLMATKGRDTALWAIAGLDDVKAGFENVPYPSEKIHFVPGKVEDTIPGQLPEQIAILRLDTDWYESTAHELAHMYDRLVSGGVLIIDDYGHWQGSRIATDEFLERTGERLLLIRMQSGRIAVKP